MPNLDKDAVESCMDEFAVWMWQHDLKVTEDEIEDFFRERGTTRHEAVAAANQYGVVIAQATFVEDSKPPVFLQLLRWVWR